MDTSGEQNGSGIGNASGASATSSFSTTSSLNSRSSHDTNTEDDHTIAAILAEDENINNGQQQQQNRLGRRLSHLDSIPHTPRVNNEIPDANDATYDHERLSERLSTYGLAELQIEGDGNCQFRGLADQLFRNPDYHKHVRKQVVKQNGLHLFPWENDEFVVLPEKMPDFSYSKFWPTVNQELFFCHRCPLEGPKLVEPRLQVKKRCYT